MRFKHQLNGKREKVTIGAYPVCTAIGEMQLAEAQPGDVLAIVKARAGTPVTAERIGVIAI